MIIFAVHTFNNRYHRKIALHAFILISRDLQANINIHYTHLLLRRQDNNNSNTAHSFSMNHTNVTKYIQYFAARASHKTSELILLFYYFSAYTALLLTARDSACTVKLLLLIMLSETTCRLSIRNLRVLHNVVNRVYELFCRIYFKGLWWRSRIQSQALWHAQNYQ